MNESEFIYGKNFSKYKKLILGTKKTWKFLPSFLIIFIFLLFLLFLILQTRSKENLSSKILRTNNL